MIVDSDISVVFQGPVVGDLDPATQRPVTAASMARVKALLPKAEIVLSTWPGQNTAGLPCDVVIENQDPGQTGHPNWFGNFYNTNRMLVSVNAGLERANRSHVLRFRTDQVLDSANFLSAFNAPQPLRSGNPCFSRRLVITNIYTGNPYRCGRPAIFHFSDMAGFGLKEDLQALWNVPLIKAEVRPADQHPLLGIPGAKLFPEQYLPMLSFLRQHPAFDLSAFKDPVQRARESERFLVDNFLVLPMEQFAVRWPNRKRHLLSRYGAYTTGELRRLHTRGTSQGFPPPADSLLPRMVFFLDAHFRSGTPRAYKSLRDFYHRVFGHR